MIKSMTGFGRQEVVDGDRRFIVEMKGVNHRYLDSNIRMPKKLNFFESAIRGLLKNHIQRGKVDVFITYEDLSEQQMALKYNETLAKEYLGYFKKMEETFSLKNDVNVSMLSKCPEVLTMAEQVIDEEQLWSGLQKALKGAFAQLVETRSAEGEALRRDMIEKLEVMLEDVAFIEKRNPEIIAQYRNKLEAKVRELLESPQLEESRVATEVVIFADKICTDEEIVRLKSHIDTMKETLDTGDGVGRKLDFIAQEMNREANTILSKANDLEVSNRAIELKTQVEKIREQIQNIE